MEKNRSFFGVNDSSLSIVSVFPFSKYLSSQLLCKSMVPKTNTNIAMDILAKSLIFFSLCHLFLIESVDSTCPKSFYCGDQLGNLKFPLSDSRQPECGLFMVNCTDSTNPRIQLGDGGTWYRLIERVPPNKYKIQDPLLQNDLSNPKNCLSLRNLSLPNSPSSSLTFFPKLTLFICDNNSFGNPTGETLENYKNYTSCGGFKVYYRQPTEDFHKGESSTFRNCTVLQMPIKSNEETGDLLSLLSAEFTLEWNVSDDCNSCHRRGGQCLADSLNEFQCKEGNSPPTLVLAAAISGGLFFVVLCLFVFFVLYMRKKQIVDARFFQKASTKNERDIELFLKNGNLAPRRYKYSELKKITKSFNENLGKGGYGNVYKGKLLDCRVVAVKVLNESKGNGEDFINEVASISRTSHVNIVTLVGFCFEGSKRALIYEFMPNGSLDKFLKDAASSSAGNGLGWEKLFEIAVGIGQGLEYLHQGCNTRILHFDIKPHNILLDKNLNPKISDFGLAKLCPNRSSIVSMLEARGTIGYIAPEVFCRNFGEVSHKSDVYSYGMMVLEIVGGRKDVDTQNQNTDGSSQTYFPDYIFKQLEINPENGSFDGIRNGENEMHYLKRKLMIVGLWCIQTDPKNRPSMTRVLEMLEGKVESLQIPPKPYSSSPRRSASPRSYDS